MDVYTVEGIITDLTLGMKVLVVGPGRSIRDAQLLLANSLEQAGIPATIRWAHGNERIRHASGGWVVFVRSATAMQRFQVDVVVAFEPISDEIRESAWPALNASRRNDPGRGLPLVATS